MEGRIRCPGFKAGAGEQRLLRSRRCHTLGVMATRPVHRLLALALAVLLGLLAAACGGGSKDEETPTAAGTVTASDLAKSVVQILALDANDDPVWSGSGTIISSEGLILTNGHVVDDRSGEYASLGIAVTERTDEPPELTYVAQIEAVDYALDLAVIRIDRDLDGNAVNISLPAVPVGDSDNVEIGDHVRILGFPGIGGETITFTEGSVSGFTAERDIDRRAWIKTDATISGGNSGGLALNDRGEIIGVPTIAGSGTEEAPVDCRYVIDTNRDGVVDSSDTCVPVGGFINGLRPVALAAPLISAAESGTEYVSQYAVPEPPGTVTVPAADISFSNLVFADGVTDNDQPTQLVVSLPAGATDACVFWDYEGMADGLAWEALWFVNGELDREGSITDDTWIGGEAGNWWVCNYNDAGLIDGLYEVVINVEGDLQGTDSIYVGGDHPIVPIDVVNQTSTDICYIFFSPTDAHNWGFDELDIDQTIAPGESATIDVASGTYDALIRDCDRNALYEEYNLDFAGGGTITVGQ